jgi:hypothetical protein
LIKAGNTIFLIATIRISAGFPAFILRDIARQLAVENFLHYTQSGNSHVDIWKSNNWDGCRMLKNLVRNRNVPR